MSLEETSASAADGKFGFPYAQPYIVQLQLMQCLYKVINDRKIGIFQSPTGTGKSLSLLCGSFRWLRDHETKPITAQQSSYVATSEDKQHATIGVSGGDEPDWVLEHSRRKQEADERQKEERRRERQRQLDKRIAAIRLQESDAAKNPPAKIQRAEADDLVMSEFESDSEDSKARSSKQLETLRRQYSHNNDNFDNDIAEDAGGSEEEDVCERQKIIIASRTHSQLAQLVSELKKTAYVGDAKVISLGSRRQMCINKDVQRLRSVQRMNDKCKDLLKSASGCPYFNGPNSEGSKDHFYDFADRSLARVQDIEELVVTGQQQKTCPYYGSRYAVAQAELITVPYSILLNPSARKSIGLSIKDNIVIIDEAHNLIDAINQLNGAGLTVAQIELCQNALRAYLQKYQSRLSGNNTVYIKQVLVCLQRFHRYFNNTNNNSQAANKDGTIIPLVDFAYRVKIDHLNLFKLCAFLDQSDIHRKIMGFTSAHFPPSAADEDVYGGDDLPSVVPSRHISPLQPVHQFLQCLTNPDKDGRIIVGEQSFQFMLLNPATYFQDIVDEARSVILAGGTMDPLEDLKAQLFPSKRFVERIQEFSCGHVIPASQLQMFILQRGRAGLDYSLTYGARSDRRLIEDIGNSLVELCAVVPDGVVVFFSSYSYLESVMTVWKESGIMQRLLVYKTVFNEPREPADGTVDSMLARYSQAIQNGPGSGAVLFAVVGGKLSEGINFSDNLGRLVVMIGMPYPNRQSPAIQERMRYADQQGIISGQDFYMNICMRAVNQSIGRAIRHQRDYASVVLMDSRYGTERVKDKLPQWMKPSIRPAETLDETLAELKRFFTSNTFII